MFNVFAMVLLYIAMCHFFKLKLEVQQIYWKEINPASQLMELNGFFTIQTVAAKKAGLLQRWTKWQMQMPKNSAKPWAPWMTLEDWALWVECAYSLQSSGNSRKHCCYILSARCIFPIDECTWYPCFFGALPMDLWDSYLMGQLILI